MKYFLTLLVAALFITGCSPSGGGGGSPAAPSPTPTPPGSTDPKVNVPFEKAVVGAWLSGCKEDSQSRDLLVVKENGEGFRQDLWFDTADCMGNPFEVSEKQNFTYKIGAEKSGARAIDVTNPQGTFPFEATIDDTSMTLKGLGQTALYQKVVAPEGMETGDPLPAPVPSNPLTMPVLPSLPPAPGQPPAGGDASAAFNAAIKGTWEMACAKVFDPQTNQLIGSQVGVLEIGDGKAVQWARLYVEIFNCSGEWSRIGILNFDYTVLSFTSGVAELDARITQGVPNPQPQRVSVSVFGNSMTLNQAGATQQYSKVR